MELNKYELVCFRKTTVKQYDCKFNFIDSFEFIPISMSNNFLDADNLAGQTLLRLVSRGNAVLAELLRLSQHVPDAFKEPALRERSTYNSVVFDFSYFQRTHLYEDRISGNHELTLLDEEFKLNHIDLLQRFFQLFESVYRYASDLSTYLSEVQDGFFVEYTMDMILFDSDGKQLLSESIYLYGMMLLLLDLRIPGYTREFLIVSFYRYKGGPAIKNIDEIITLCRSTGFSPSDGTKRPLHYPEQYFSRIPIPSEIARMAIGRIRSDDIYNQAIAYPDPDHRSFALSGQASLLYVILYFCPNVLHDEQGLMREIVDKHFGDNWVISIFMGVIVDLKSWWEPYEAASSAIRNITSRKQVIRLSSKFKASLFDVKFRLDQYMCKGVLDEELVLTELNDMLKLIRNSNTTLKWLMLHRTSANRKIREAVSEGVSDDDILLLLLNISQFELKFKDILHILLKKRKKDWAHCKTEGKGRADELSEFFSGAKPLVRIKRDESLEKWFNDVATQIDSLDDENATVAARKIGNLIGALENVEEFHKIESHLQVKQFLLDTRSVLKRMICIVNVRESHLTTLSIVSDFSWCWQIIQIPPYSSLMQSLVTQNPKTCFLLRATFLKLVSILDLPLVRINQCSSQDVISVAAYYSSQLVNFIREILEVIPKSIFQSLNEIIELRTDKIPEIPLKLQRSQLPEYARLDERYELAKATHHISVLSEGILAMKKTFVGLIELNPRELLEEGVRKELVLQVSQTLNDSIDFKSSKPSEFETKLQSVSQRLSGIRRSIEYIQDYLGVYGLKMWQEEISRIVNYNVEQESNQFVKKKVQDWESVYQNSTIPVPQFTSKEESSVNFMGRLVRKLLKLSDHRKTVYSYTKQSWEAQGTAVIGIRTFDLLNHALGTEGLVGIDRLLCHMVSSDLHQIHQKCVETAESAEISVLMDHLMESIVPLTEMSAETGKTMKHYLSQFEKLSVLKVSDVLACVGQKQLIRKQIGNELMFTSVLDSKLLFCHLKSINHSLLVDLRRNPDENISDKEIFPELVKFLEASGMTDPTLKIYIPTAPFRQLGVLMALIVLRTVSMLHWSSKLQSQKAKRDSIDALPFVLGVSTFLKQFHPKHTEIFIQILCQYLKCIGEDLSKNHNDLPGEANNVLLFLETLIRFTNVSKDLISRYIPEYLIDKFKH